MEMTEHGKPRSRLSTVPPLLGTPFGITFPRPRLLGYFKMQEHERPNPRAFRPQGGCNGGPWSKVGRTFKYTQARGHIEMKLRPVRSQRHAESVEHFD